MIITQPPDAKLPLHLHAYASTTQLTQSDDHSNIIHDYPPSNHRPASIADSELPPAYIDPSSSADEDRRPLNPRLAAMTPKQRQRRKRRFKIMAGSVLAVYVLSTSTLLVLFWTGHLARRLDDNDRDWGPGYGLFTPVLPPGYRPAGAALSDGEAIQCNAWTSEQVVTVAAAATSTTTTAASTSTHKSKGGRRSVKPEFSNYLRYTLSPNATTSADALNLFIHAGQYAASSGTFSVATDDTITTPLVDVTMKYRDAYALNITQVCLMRNYDTVGLGIYTSDETGSDHPTFDIQLHLPANMFIDSLSTDLSYFTQTIGRPQEQFATQFGTLQLQGMFSPLYVQGANVQAETVDAQTSFSTIWGEFITSKALILKTSQAPINVNVSLIRNSDEAIPVKLSLTTENAIIQSQVTLSTSANATSSDPSVADFDIAASTHNAPISMAVMHANGSAASMIDLKASSSYAPVVISLDPDFEGSFSLSSGVGAQVVKDDGVPDPQDLGRTRSYSISLQNRYDVDGFVFWDPPKPGGPRMGSANLTTQHAKAVLYLPKTCWGTKCPHSTTLGAALPALDWDDTTSGEDIDVGKQERRGVASLP